MLVLHIHKVGSVKTSSDTLVQSTLCFVNLVQIVVARVGFRIPKNPIPKFSGIPYPENPEKKFQNIFGIF